LTAALQHYRKIGRRLQGAEDLQNFVTELATKRNQAEPHGCFFLIDAPSGTGKTQLPFALKEAELNVCHLLMSRWGGPTQVIYKTLQSHSELFLQALDLDQKRMNWTRSISGILLVISTPLPSSSESWEQTRISRNP
jgi:hypothetical protein